jgi:hypothetical protein
MRLAVENSTRAGLPTIESHSLDEVGYHAHLLIDMRLAEGYSRRNQGHQYQHDVITSLTTAGHEFAELARDDGRWSGAIAQTQSGGAVTFDILKHLLANPTHGMAVEPQKEGLERSTGHLGKLAPPEEAGNGDHSGSNAPSDHQQEMTSLGAPCDPLFWQHFNRETSKKSRFRDLLIYNFVNCSVPKLRTDRDVVRQIAEESHIPVESLSDDLNQPVYPRGQAFSDYAGNVFDQIAGNYPNMQW